MTVTENKINHIVAITNGSDIYFPKKLMARRDLADDTKLLFAVVLLHLSAALVHAWIFRDGVFASMAKSTSRSSKPPTER